MNKEDLYKLYDDVNKGIRAIDTKTGILMSFVALLLGISSILVDAIRYLNGNVGYGPLEISLIIFISLFFILAVISIITCLRVIIARDLTQNDNSYNKDSILFYKNIAKLDYESFVENSKMLDDEILRNDLKNEIYKLSRLADKKHDLFNLSLAFSIALFFVSFILLILVGLI